MKAERSYGAVWRIVFDAWGCGGNEKLIVAPTATEAIERLCRLMLSRKEDPTEVFVAKIKFLGHEGDE